MTELYLEQVLGECRCKGDTWEQIARRVLDRLSSDSEGAFFRQQGEEALCEAVFHAGLVADTYSKTGASGPNPAWMFLKAMGTRFGLEQNRFS
jgi:hypothetical protein